MELREIFDLQQEFDSKRPGWSRGGKNEDQTMRDLMYDTIAIAGEVGEFANMVKKALREKEYNNSFPGEEKLSKMREELVDVFIYLMKLMMSLNGDLERDYLAKLKKNEERFARFVK
jgi:NTP pyrophosphatase (non-canonical NTP hydrolase)